MPNSKELGYSRNPLKIVACPSVSSAVVANIPVC